MTQLVAFTDRAPALVAAAGARASYRFFEFFTAQICNPHTRHAYARAAVDFFDWLEARSIDRRRAFFCVFHSNQRKIEIVIFPASPLRAAKIRYRP